MSKPCVIWASDLPAGGFKRRPRIGGWMWTGIIAAGITAGFFVALIWPETTAEILLGWW